MPDEFDRRRPGQEAVTLSGLPLQSPPRSAWPALQASLQARRARRRRPLWLALAASLAMAALLLPRLLPTPEAPATPAATAAAMPPADGEAQLRALMAESAQLEALVAWSGSERVESAVVASLGSALQERIQTLDALLARPDTDPDALVPLWQERVLRLRQLAGLETTGQLLAANGQSDGGVPVLAF